jgi:hypothetical protein
MTNNYHHVALQPATYERLVEFQEEYFGTDSVPNGESVEALLTEYNGEEQ